MARRPILVVRPLILDRRNALPLDDLTGKGFEYVGLGAQSAPARLEPAIITEPHMKSLKQMSREIAEFSFEARDVLVQGQLCRLAHVDGDGYKFLADPESAIA